MGGPGGGRFWGHFWGLSALENGPTNHPIRGLPLHPSVRNKSQDGDGCARGTCGAVADVDRMLRGRDGRFRHDAGRVTQQQWHDGGIITHVFESSGSVHGMEGPRCVILKTTSSDVGTGAQPRSVLVSWRSQPSGLVPTTSVGELNSIGEPKNPSVVHPPHSTVLRREEGKGIHIQLTDRKIYS